MPRHRRLWIVLLFVAAMWAVFEVTGLRARIDPALLRDAFARHRGAGLALFTLLFVLGNLIQLPGWLFLAGAVLALGAFWGFWATYLAACVSCLATFWLIRALGRNALREFTGPLAARVLGRLDAHPLQSVLVLRLVFQTVPALNYALAMSGVSLRHYLLGTALGLPLPILVYVVFFRTLARALHWPLPA